MTKGTSRTPLICYVAWKVDCGVLPGSLVESQQISPSADHTSRSIPDIPASEPPKYKDFREHLLAEGEREY
ncbi:MAG: hypothetical protein AB9873_18625 [Syntrophobacteraceae bacterium]